MSYIIQIDNEYLVRYKVKAGGEWILTLNPSIEFAASFESDDYVISLCRKRCENFQLLDALTKEPAIESPAETDLSPFEWL